MVYCAISMLKIGSVIDHDISGLESTSVSNSCTTDLAAAMSELKDAKKAPETLHTQLQAFK